MWEWGGGGDWGLFFLERGVFWGVEIGFWGVDWIFGLGRISR